MYTPTFNETILVRGNEMRNNQSKPLTKNFGDNFEYEIGKSNGPKVVEGISIRSLGNKSKEVGV